LAESIERILAEFLRSEQHGAPKHTRLKQAILKAIGDGVLSPGDRLPAEQDFSKALGLALGTVQRALNSLAHDQAITREQGRGTFVSTPTLRVEDLWEYRFVEKYGASPLPIKIEQIGRQTIAERNPWLDVLGHDHGGYCELTRIVTVNDDLRCLSRIYVRNSRFPEIAKLPKSAVPGNLKKFFAEQLKTPTHSVEQFLGPCRLTPDLCALLKIKPSPGMRLNSIGRTISEEAITFQTLWIPHTEYLLEMSAGKRPRRSDARSGINGP
jgi:DNA-binding GntR family transcriptional regulator